MAGRRAVSHGSPCALAYQACHLARRGRGARRPAGAERQEACRQDGLQCVRAVCATLSTKLSRRALLGCSAVHVRGARPRVPVRRGRHHRTANASGKARHACQDGLSHRFRVGRGWPMPGALHRALHFPGAGLAHTRHARSSLLPGTQRPRPSAALRAVRPCGLARPIGHPRSRRRFSRASRSRHARSTTHHSAGRLGSRQWVLWSGFASATSSPGSLSASARARILSRQRTRTSPSLPAPATSWCRSHAMGTAPVQTPSVSAGTRPSRACTSRLRSDTTLSSVLARERRCRRSR